MNLGTLFVLLIEWLPFVVLFKIFQNYKIIKNAFIYTTFFLVLPFIQFFVPANYFYFNIISQLLLLSLFFYFTFFKNNNKNRDYYVYLILVYAFIFVNNIWNIVLSLHVEKLFFPTLKEVFSVEQNISSLFYFNNKVPELNNFESIIYKDFIILKFSMLMFFALSWGFLYKIVNLAHNNKIFFSGNNIEKFNLFDKCFFFFSIILISFQSYLRAGFDYLFFGIFLLYFIHAVLLFILLYFILGLYCELKKKSLNLLLLLSISNILIGGHLFELLNDILMKYPSIYFFAKHGTPSFGTALSLTYIIFLAIPAFLCFFIYYIIIKKFKFSINYLIGTISFLSLIGVIFVSHETIVSHLVNKTDEIYDSYINEKLIEHDLKSNGKIKVGSFEEFSQDLLNCRICKINTTKSIPLDKIHSDILELNKYQLYQQLNGKKYNLKLIYFGVNVDNKIVYSLNQGNHVTFVTLSLYALFYFLIFIFWFSFIIYINSLHSKKLKPLLT